jgi:hypothetical protein
MEQRELMRMAVFLLDDATTRIAIFAQAVEATPMRERLRHATAVLAEHARAVENSCE